MDTQEYLEKFKGLEHLIEAKSETLKGVQSLFDNLTITDQEIFAKVTSIQDGLKVEIQKLVTAQKELCRKIDLLPEKELKAVLALRYVSMKTWEQVAKILDVSVRWVFTLHERALAAFEVVLHLEQDSNMLVTETAYNPVKSSN